MGGIVTAFAATSSAYDPDPKTGQSTAPRGPVLGLGIGVLGVGLVGLSVGIYLLATSASEVTIDYSNTMGNFVRRGFQLTF